MPNQQLIDYIKKSKAAGQTDEQIKSALKQSGWQDSEIEENLNSLTGPPPVQNYSDVLYGNKQEANFITSENKSGKKFITTIVIVFVLLAGGASAYYFRDSLPVIKDWAKKEEQVAINNNGQQSELQPQATDLPKTEQQLQPKSPTPQPIEKQNCGSVNNLHILAEPEKLTGQEKESMLCMSRALENCKPAIFELAGEKAGGLGAGSDFEIKGKEDEFCSIYGHSDESTILGAQPFKKTCKVPLALIADGAKYVIEKNAEEYLFISYGLFFTDGKVTDTRTGQEIKLDCK